MPLSGPTAVRRQLGRRLRQLRHAARKTEADVEEANLASRAKLWRIETGKVGVKIGDVRGLCWLYGADTATTDALATMAALSNQQGHWEDQRNLPFQLWLYAGMEPIADEVRIYAPDMIPDLLQTPGYFRELHLAINPDQTGEGLREQAKLHLERQEIVFSRHAPPRLTAILNVGALVLPVGGDDVMIGQIAHLHELNRSDCIDIRVLPWGAGAHSAMRGGAFTILDFHHQDDPPVAYAGALTGARYAEKADEVNEFRRIFRELYDKTIPIEMNDSSWA
jgi:transcriptional regulator with XRE-family HTH domain